MAETTTTPRLMAAAKEFNIGKDMLVDFLESKGFNRDDLKPTAKLTEDMYRALQAEFQSDKVAKMKSEQIDLPRAAAAETRRKRDEEDISIRKEEKKATKPKRSISEEEFLARFGPGTVFEAPVIRKIQPSLVLVEYFEGFSGRLFVQDISHCLPLSIETFHSYKVGDKISCVVKSVDFKNNCVNLSQRHVYKQLSDSVKWDRLERGDETKGAVVEVLNSSYLIKTEQGFYGLLNKHFVDDVFNPSTKLRVQSKVDESDVISLIPASFDAGITFGSEDSVAVGSFGFIDSELTSYASFKNSILGHHASDDDLEFIRDSFGLYPNIFSKDVVNQCTIYLQFTWNSSAYETIFKHNAVPYFLDGELYSKENEQKLLERFSREKYWFKLNQRKWNGDNEVAIEFTIFNEDLNFYGAVYFSKDKKECAFLIKNFSFGHSFYSATEAKKKNSGNGSYLLNTPLRVLSPFENLPYDNDQKSVVEFVIRKNACFNIVDRLQLDAGEILKTEGRTLGIIDKFLEFQMSLLDAIKLPPVFVDSFERVPSESGGVCIMIAVTVADSLELEEDSDGSVVNLKLKQESLKVDQEDELVRYTDGLLSYEKDHCKIVFFREVNLDLLEKGFYLEKKNSKKQLLIQREIIQDFLQKKIKIDHIESLLVKPDKVKTPITSALEFKNPDLARTETEQPDNNQVKAVKKAVGNQNIFLVQGPPGTGKTTVIAEIIEQLVAKGERILVAGQNHVAVDNVLEKIARQPHLNLLRVGKPDRVNEELVKYTIENLVDDYKKDFLLFLNNQLQLIKEYRDLKSQGKPEADVKQIYTQRVNGYCEAYGRIREVLKERHFILRDALSTLSLSELSETINTYQEWILRSSNEIDILLRPLIYNSVDVVFATCIGIKTDLVFRDISFKFDTVIIDEAGKANIAETLVPIELGKKVILVGDQMQLPPYIDSALIDEKEPRCFQKTQYGSDFAQEEIAHALKTSFFEFLINRIGNHQFPAENLEMLNYQHRMHPNIGEFVSRSFYGGSVRMGKRTHLNRLSFSAPFDKEVVFFDTSNLHNPYEQNEGCSVKNITEAEAISEYILPKLFENHISATDVAIIAPYKSQVATIQNYIKTSSVCNHKNIEVSTLDSFQGKEFDIIIFSFTRSANHNNPEVINGRKKYTKVGFLDDARRLNVAFSRAKKKLILIGNAVSLTDRRSHFDGLFNYTKLFNNLVELSKNESIGNLVNIADYYRFDEEARKHEKSEEKKRPNKEQFALFLKQLRKDDLVKGVLKEKVLDKSSGDPKGIVLTISTFDVYIPLTQIPPPYRSLEEFAIGSTLDAQVIGVNEDAAKLLLSLYNMINWTRAVNSLRREGRYKAEIRKELATGCFVDVKPYYLSAFIPKNRLRNKNALQKQGDLSREITVRVESIDFKRRKLQVTQL